MRIAEQAYGHPGDSNGRSNSAPRSGAEGFFANTHVLNACVRGCELDVAEAHGDDGSLNMNKCIWDVGFPLCTILSSSSRGSSTSTLDT